VKKPDHQKYIDLNHQAWNRYTSIHVDSPFYDLDSFKKGRSTLHPTELEEIGEIKGKSLLHLQCHFGQDTLSFERLGATATGVDLSDESIREAKSLRNELGLNSTFIQSDIYDLDKMLHDSYDIVFTSYGVILWLPDLKEWARIIHSLLNPGGTFYIIEFHPFLDIIDEEFTFFKYPYFDNKDNQPLEFSEKGTYANPDADIESTTYGWPHSIGDVITALSESGLQIKFLHEFPFSYYNIFPKMIEFSPGKYYHKEIRETIPYMFSVMAVKP